MPSPKSSSWVTTVSTSTQRGRDALPAHADELGGALHLTREHVDVDVGTLELLEDLLELGNGLAIADRRVAHLTSLVICPLATVVTSRVPMGASDALRTTAPRSSLVIE